MDKTKRISTGLLICVLFAGMGCSMAPRIQILTPADNTSVTVFSLPSPLDIEINVPLPKLAGKTDPIDPDSLTATLQRFEGRVAVGDPIPIDVHNESVFEHIEEDGNHTWIGTQEIADIGDYRLTVTVANSTRPADNPAVAVSAFQVEVNAAEFPGGFYGILVRTITQGPGTCLVPDLFNLVLDTIRNLINVAILADPSMSQVTIPSGQEILAATQGYEMTIPLPLLGDVDVQLTIDSQENLIVLDGPEGFYMDLNALNLPLEGYECVVVADVSGIFNDLDPSEPGGQLFFDIQDVMSMGNCSLNLPTGDCTLTVSLFGTPVEE